MPLEITAVITHDAGAKEPFVIEIPAYGFKEEGSGDIDEMMAEAISQVQEKIKKEFGKLDVEMVGYKARIFFDVSAPVNMTLGSFRKKEGTKDQKLAGQEEDDENQT